MHQFARGTDLVLNIAPEGCMVANMAQMAAEPARETAGGGRRSGRIQGIFSLEGAIDEEKLALAALKILGPEKYYRAD